MLVAGLLVAFLATVLAISSGNTGMCNAHDALLGCTTWGTKPDPLDDRRVLVNRLNCTTPGRIMSWATVPVRSNLYTVRSGNEGPVSSDVAYYHPDEYLTITVRATQYKKRYRGLLLYAVNTSGSVVGNFHFAPEAEAVPFWTPSNWATTCGKGIGNAVLHKNADEKPYTTHFRWKAPPAGSGTVVFKALFKSGPANDGDFWWPANGGRNDLTLSERNPAIDGVVPPKVWFKASTSSKLCADVCQEAGRRGVDTTLMALTKDGGDGLSTYHPNAAEAYERTELCRFPFVSSCAVDSPGVAADGFCTFQPASCPAWRLTAAAGRKRMCACLTESAAISPCAQDQDWPQTNPGQNATLSCGPTQTGIRYRTCSSTGVWGTAVSTCVTAPTCSDQTQNQGEYGIDCGGPCPACLNCPTINCGAHGACVEGTNAYCQCTDGWMGNRCENPPPNPCDTWQCANGGTCQPTSATTAQCLCGGAWIGAHCDQLPAPTCTDGIKNQNEVGVDCGGVCRACDAFKWVQGVWSDCSRSCGGGQRTRGMTCTNSTDHVRPSTDCASIHLPETIEQCNPDVCPTYTWVVEDWDACNSPCGGGIQTRTVKCISSLGNVTVTTVGLCDESLKPATSQQCNLAACQAPRWVSDPWGECNLPCGGGIQTRGSRCISHTTQEEVPPDNCNVTLLPSTQQACNIFACVSYDWFLCPNWGPCTATCGGGDGMLGQQFRDLFCAASDGTQVDFSLCDPLRKPKNVLTVCNTFPCTDFNWMADGDWSSCNGTHRERSFHCHAANGMVATAKECEHVPKPIRAIPCTMGLTECYDLPPTPWFLSSAPKMQTSLPFVLAALSAVVSSPRMGLLSVVLLATIAPVEAHNWLFTPGRASFQASTVAPCQARKDSDLHAQVTYNQRFTIRFATGHERDSYFVTLNGEDADMLGHDDFEAMVDKYLADAVTAGSEDHIGSYTRRYHGFNGNRNLAEYSSTTGPIGRMFTGAIPETDPRYPKHTRSNATGMYNYQDSALTTDRRAAYVSADPKLKWIISAARLPHLYHLPDDFDSLHWSIPQQSNVKPGHVIVHWRWSGYYDCIDVDLRTDGTVEFPDGKYDPTNHVWSQIDHCQYEDPINIMTQCMEVIDTVQPCMNALGQGDWNVNNRYGLNVVPFRNPATVNPAFAGEVYIPWRNGACSSSWNQLPGAVSETQLDWTTWLANSVTITANATCGGTLLEDTTDWDLKRAVGYCVGRPTCTGIAWEKIAGTTVQSPGNKHFRICQGTTTTSNAAWTLYRPSSAPTPVTLTPSTVYTINFAPLSRVSNTPTVANMVTDAGYVYGSRTGANGAQTNFGWSCSQSVDCPWCCSTWACPTSGAPRDNTLPGCCNGEIDFTYMYAANDRCPQTLDTRKNFNYDLPNGIYEVTTKHQGSDYNSVDIGGCNIENVRMVKGRDDATQAGVELKTLVEVTDGKLTFNGDAGVDAGCWFTNWIKFEYKAPVGTWPSHWMPPPKPNPVWEQNVGSPMPIGLVTIENYEWFRPANSPICSAWWLFKGSACYPNKASGWFNDTTSQGAIVGVSNVSCLTGNCAGFVQCGTIQLAANLWDNRYFVDCNGKVGQYVFVKLPGANRYLTVTVAAYLYAPLVPQNENPFVCYAVEARPATTTSPEYVISLDPEDPIFYSTCYVRNPNIIWLPRDGGVAPEPDRWRFNGRCIACDSFHRNKAINKPNFASLPVPWVVTDGQCVDCAAETGAPLNPVTPTWVQTYMSDCDDPATQTTSRGLPSCSGSGFASCSKRLFARGRTESEPTWGSAVLTVTECQAVAARDADCSSAIHYYDGGGWTVCECHRAHPCCGVCTPNSWSQQGVTRTPSPKVSYQVYDRSVSLVPDAYCNTGIKSTTGNLCCPATCKDSTGKNVCGVQYQCRNAVGGGTCCKGDFQTLFINNCTQTGPPCLL